MENAYQNSTISQILEAILEQTTFTGTSNSNIADILLSILYNTPYDEEPKSVLAELFLKLKAKIENEPFEPYDKEPKSVLAEILLSILNETEYTKPATSRIGELLLQLKEELEKYAEVTVSGAICNFNTSLVKPLVNLKAYFEATQESGTPTPQSPKAISGVSAVNVTHCGANIWNEQWELGGFAFANGTLTPSTDRIRNKIPIKVKPNTQYFAVAPARFAVGYYDKDGNYLGYQDNKDNSIFTTKPDTDYIYFFCVVASYGNNISINTNTSDTTYHAYNGNVVTIALGGTYYGGYVEQDKDGKRVLTPTYKYLKIEIDNAWTLYSEGNQTNIFRRQYYVSTADAPKSENNQMCNVATLDAQAYQTSDSRLNTFVLGTSRTLYFQLSKTDYPTVDAFKNYLANNDIYIRYELATPLEPINLTDGEPIITFNGDNNIYNDSANTEVTYLTTINDNINRAVTVKRQQDRLKELEKEALKPKDEVIVEEPKPIEKELKK